MRTVYGDHKRFEETYFSTFKGRYFSGDGARRDKDGYFWIPGRVDDVLNVSGHRMGTAEVESALVSHESVAEAAVVGKKDDIKGEFYGVNCAIDMLNNLPNKQHIMLIAHNANYDCRFILQYLTKENPLVKGNRILTCD